MPLETAQYINTLQPDWPLGTDPESMGDDHLRMIKQVLQNTFPNMNAACGLTPAQGNYLENGFVYQAAAAPNIELWKSRSHAKDDGSLMAIMALTPTAQNFKDNPSLLVTYQALLNIMMPIGTVYENYSNGTNPATLLGFGTWTALKGYSVAVGACTDQAGLSVTFGAAHNGATGDWRVTNDMIVQKDLSLVGTAVPAHHHTLVTDSNASEKSDFALSLKAAGTVGIAGISGSSLVATDKNGSGTVLMGEAGGHTPAGHVTIGTGTTTSGTQFIPPYHSTYRWVRTA